VQGAKLGVETGIEGAKAAGSAGVGLVEGGQAQAKERWEEDKQSTRETAHEDAAQAKRQARTP
jgi:hypothetical protein